MSEMENPSPSRVWIVNYAGHDYSAAKSWGELRYMTRGYVSFERLDRLLYEVADIVDGTSPSDWLLPSGLVVLNVIAGIVWLIKHGHVNLLLWDHREETYLEMKITGERITDLFKVLSHDDGQEASQREASSGAS